MHYTGASLHDVENPWAHESIDKSSDDSRGPHPDMSGNDFSRGDSFGGGQASMIPPETQNREPFDSPTVHQAPYIFDHDQTGGAQSAYSNKLQSNNPFLKAVQQSAAPSERSRDEGESSPHYSEAPNGQGNNHSGTR